MLPGNIVARFQSSGSSSWDDVPAVYGSGAGFAGSFQGFTCLRTDHTRTAEARSCQPRASRLGHPRSVESVNEDLRVGLELGFSEPASATCQSVFHGEVFSGIQVEIRQFENQAAWTSLYRRLEGRLGVVGISLSDPEATRAYRESHKLPFPVVVPADTKGFIRQYEVNLVSTTIRIDREGIVRDSWVGALSKKTLMDLSS